MLKTADLKFKSKKADGADVYVKVDESTGEITVFLSADSGTSAVDPKLSVSSASSTSSSN